MHPGRFFLVYILAPIFYIIFAPVTFLYEFLNDTLPDLYKPKNSPERHRRKVQNIVEQVKKWNKDGRRKPLCTSRPGWQRTSMYVLDKSEMNQIKIDLDDIVEIDTKNMTITIEPGMNMGRLTKQLLPLGYTVPCVPELQILTVGGLLCGAGIETASHKYGPYAVTCDKVEIVLADGRVVECTETNEYKDLWYSIPMSHGTLGFVTAVTMPLIKCERYVKHEYIPVTKIERVEELLKDRSHEFVELLVFGKNQFVVMYGDFAAQVEDPKTQKVQTYLSHYYDLIFHRQVKSFLKYPEKRVVEYIPIRDYYHRHDRAGFWLTDVAIPYANNTLFRYLFGWIFPINMTLLKCLLTLPAKSWVMNHGMVGQDIVIPIDTLKGFLELVHEEVEVYPLWCCPMFLKNNPGICQPRDGKDTMYINVGIYGFSTKVKNSEKAVTKMHQYAMKRSGFQATYAEMFLTREEFHEMFNLDLINKVRRDLKCEDAFPHPYDKIRPNQPKLKSG